MESPKTTHKMTGKRTLPVNKTEIAICGFYGLNFQPLFREMSQRSLFSGRYPELEWAAEIEPMVFMEHFPWSIE